VDIEVQTSVMAPIDCAQPIVDNELEVSGNIHEIRRKTRYNIVNTEHEHRAEELAWYFLFPYGINGWGEQREIKITPLDYYQQRILGSDLRFQRNDYLFYTLSMFEYKRIKATIQACLKKLVGPDGKIEDLHLITKSIERIVGLLAYSSKRMSGKNQQPWSTNVFHHLQLQRSILDRHADSTSHC